MNRRFTLSAGIAATLVASVGASAAAESSADVEQAVDALTKAMLATDGAALKELTLAGLSYGHSGGRVEDQAAFIGAFVSKQSTFSDLKLSNRSASVMGDLAIARHVLDGISVADGKSTPVHIGVLQVWKRDSEKWRLFARQAYKL